MLKKPPLTETHPEIANQWHPTKNGDLFPEKVSKGSNKKVWWKCPKGNDHEWEAVIYSRVDKNSCPVCSNQKVVTSNCLATLNPELAEQWHPTKNGTLTPYLIVPGSNKKVWWKCSKGVDHEWESPVASRTKGTGCPICSNQKIVLSNCLATLNPELTEQWHPKKNQNITPFEVGLGSHKKVWWKCPKGNDHEWEAAIFSRVNGSDCPVCVNLKIVLSNCLATLNPELAKQWHPTKNQNITPFEVGLGSEKKVWWKCPIDDDHEWEAVIWSRNYGNGCPVCTGRKVVISNSLEKLNPELAEQWHPSLNKDLKPSQVTVFSNKKVWWKCKKGENHEWKARISSRNEGNGCPICDSKKIVLSNSLATLNPELAKQWHPTKNGVLTPFNVALNSNKKVWWKCDKFDDHEWYANIYNRSGKGYSCPFCNLTPQSKQELIITFELLKFFKDINPKGYKTRLNGKLRAIDIFIPDLNLAIEFDGSYWHKDKRAIDKIKSEMLMKEGYQVIRIREEPLKKIHENDIISSLPYNGKELTNKILKKILELFNLSNSVQKRVHDYISRDGLQNEKALDKYIDQILEEKAAKKK